GAGRGQGERCGGSVALHRDAPTSDGQGGSQNQPGSVNLGRLLLGKASMAWSGQGVAGGAVDVLGYRAGGVAGAGRSGGFEHQDGATGRGRLVFGTSVYDEHIPGAQRDRPLGAVGRAQRDVEVSVEGEKELVGVVVDVPHVLALGVRDLDVV